MSAAHVWVISCNATGCKARVGGWERAGDARRDLALVGWRHEVVTVTARGPGVTVDLCPEHASIDARSVVPARGATVADVPADPGCDRQRRARPSRSGGVA